MRQRQVEEERRRKANRKAVGIAIAVAIATLVFLLSREQSSTLVRRSGSDASPSKKSAPFAKDVREPGPRQGLELPPPIAPVTKPAEPAAASAKPVQEKAAVPLSSAPIAVAKVPAQPESVAAHPSASMGSDGPLEGLSVDGPAGPEGPLVLDLDATELSWVVVQVDSGSPQEALLRPGEKAQWKAQDQFTVTLGNAGGVRAELNGKPQKPFGPSGKVVRDVVLKR